MKKTVRPERRAATPLGPRAGERAAAELLHPMRVPLR